MDSKPDGSQGDDIRLWHVFQNLHDIINDYPTKEIFCSPVDHSQWNSGKERCAGEIVLGLDDPQPGLRAGNHEIQASDPDHPVQCRSESRLDNPETKANDNHQHPKKFNSQKSAFSDKKCEGTNNS